MDPTLCPKCKKPMLAHENDPTNQCSCPPPDFEVIGDGPDNPVGDIMNQIQEKMLDNPFVKKAQELDTQFRDKLIKLLEDMQGSIAILRHNQYLQQQILELILSKVGVTDFEIKRIDQKFQSSAKEYRRPKY